MKYCIMKTAVNASSETFTAALQVFYFSMSFSANFTAATPSLA
jgi:hypothetical protein